MRWLRNLTPLLRNIRFEIERKQLFNIYRMERKTTRQSLTFNLRAFDDDNSTGPDSRSSLASLTKADDGTRMSRIDR